MRVAMVAAAWEVDVEAQRSHMTELSEALCARGHEVVLYLRQHSPMPLQRQRAKRGYQVVRVPAGPTDRLSGADLVPHLDEFAAFLDDHWSGWRPDVVHLRSWLSALAVGGGRDIPVVQSFHGLGIVEQRFRDTEARTRLDIERRTGAAAGRVVAASAEEVSDLVRMGVPRSRTSFVPCGIDTGLFTPDGPAMRSGGGPRLIATGDVRPHSGLDTAISALQSVPRAQLVIAGHVHSTDPREDPEVRRLVEHARRLGVADRVKFTGGVDRSRRPALLRSADVVLCPSWYEPLGATALEAMACGVPVVASAVGAFNDAVVDGVTGVLVPPRDSRALGFALRDLLADSTRRQMCAIAGVDRVQAR
ncbi:glycosyltransferase [Umezawaea sp. Da 62-37]|uniref:glycosyltransferase n=1 Tax=Umezawaea sp. Da 62-37 TaxID=3075927 RepID=UPI0028F7440E|nr:glycosyltransferase [Umezawaea sp. Da 62-37]WNV87825.1 glycosyltransferase [Umezawaea sp. Da 62-37]